MANPDADIDEEDGFLLSQGDGALIFMSPKCLRVLHQSEFWVCDGTFTYVPKLYAQLYTIHGFVRGEGMPVGHALLPNKNLATYTLLFSTIRDALVNEMGSVGSCHTVLLDFELAAHQAVFNIFPQFKTRGCTFHLGQAMWRKAVELGLKTAYEDEASGVKHWMRLVRALALLPNDLVLGTWMQWLRHFPEGVADAVLQHKLRAFAVYVQVRDYFSDDYHISRQERVLNYFPFLKNNNLGRCLKTGP